MTRDQDSSRRPFLVNDEEMRILDRMIAADRLASAEEWKPSGIHHFLVVVVFFAATGCLSVLLAAAFKILRQ